MNFRFSILSSVLAAFMLAATTYVQVPSQAQEVVQRKPRVVAALEDWEYRPLYQEGWSARRLFKDATVYGVGGDELGTLKNILLDRKGAILGIIAEVGGFLNIGETNVFVPWDRVEVATLRRIYIPITEENVDEYRATPSALTRALAGSIRAVEGNLRTEPGVWKATDLINDSVYLEGNVEYGYVRDLIFGGDGELYAYVVSAHADRGGGHYALPYTAQLDWDPAEDTFRAPYREVEVQALDHFDYARMRTYVGISPAD